MFCLVSAACCSECFAVFGISILFFWDKLTGRALATRLGKHEELDWQAGVGQPSGPTGAALQLYKQMKNAVDSKKEHIGMV